MRGITVLALAGALAVSACASKETYSVSTSVGSTPALLTTADLRIVTERVRPVGPGQDPALGQRVFCAEPSPDVAKALSTAMQISGNLQGRAPTGTSALGGGAGFSNATAEQLAQLTSRVPSIQALRDGLFRACEAYANGSIGDNAYSLILSRYGDVLVTLLLSENAAGLHQSSLALLGGIQLAPPPLSAAQPSPSGTAKAPANEKGTGTGGGGADATAGDANGAGTVTSALPMMVAEASTTPKPTDDKKQTSNDRSAGLGTMVTEVSSDVFPAMQKHYLQHEPTGPLMVLCSNVLDTTRPMHDPSTRLVRMCEDFFQDLFRASVRRMDSPPTTGIRPQGASSQRPRG